MIKKLLFAIAVAALFSTGCEKEYQDPLLGSWKSFFPIDNGSGFLFREGCAMCRYADLRNPDAYDCQYRYYWTGDTVTVYDAAGYVDAWRIVFVLPDVVQAIHVEYDNLPGAPYYFLMKRDHLWAE